MNNTVVQIVKSGNRFNAWDAAGGEVKAEMTKKDKVVFQV